MSDEAVVSKTCSFYVCSECKKGCCQDAKPPLTEERKKIIRDYLTKQGILMKQPFKKKSYSFPSVDAMGFCVFYHRETKKCTVHPVKPETCRAGPVTFDINRRTKKVEWFLKTRAICEFAAKLHQNDEQFAEHFKIAREEILRLICKLDSEDLRAILSIEEPQTFKIGEDALPQKVVDKFG